MIFGSPEPRRLANRLGDLSASSAVRRTWLGDYTVWGSRPDEIANRLGWLHLPRTMAGQVVSLKGFARSVRCEGIDAVVLLGMGGSSLAPETLARTMSTGGPEFTVLDTTHPSTVLRSLGSFNPARTLVIVSTKSGTTSETLALFRAFYDQAQTVLGREKAGRRFVAITDPGSPLVALAQAHGFREIFLNDPTVGGRYAALSLVGLVPAALLGLDLESLLDSARSMAERCAPSVPTERNPAALLAAFLAAHADDGRDKLTIALPESTSSFGPWLEQLIAESTGKDGRGVVPVVGEAVGPAAVYGEDRVFVRFAGAGGTPTPAVTVASGGPESLGGQFLLWEFATALLGHLLSINPFDQPDVESSKSVTRAMLSAYQERGERPSAPTAPLTPDAVRRLADQAAPGDYIAILAYLDPTAGVTSELAALRQALRDATRCATTLGCGPRFLHSTGQLHKGDAGRGLFLEIVDEPTHDVPIPDGVGHPLSFGLLIRAQAFGDAAALARRGRRVALFDLGQASSSSLCEVAMALRSASIRGER